VDHLTVLTEPTRDLEELVDQAELKLESATPAARDRFENIVMPKVEEARKLIAQKSSRARQAIDDALLLLRELVAIAPQIGPERT
jgi:hypothetical protein